MKKLFLFILVTMTYLSCTKTVIREYYNKPAENVTTKKVDLFSNDSVTRDERNNYLKLKFKEDFVYLRIITSSVSDLDALDKLKTFNDNVGVIFVYDTNELSCIDTSKLPVKSDLIYLKEDGTVIEISNSMLNTCSSELTSYVIVMPFGFANNYDIEVDDKINLKDLE